MKPKRQMFAVLRHVLNRLWQKPQLVVFTSLTTFSLLLLCPTLVGASSFTYVGEYSMYANDADIEGDYLFVASREKIEVFEIQEEDRIVKVSEYYEAGCDFQAIDAVNKRAYVTQSNYNCNYSMDIIDFFDFNNPHKLLDESIPRGAVGTAEIKVVGDMVYTVSDLSIVDFSNLHEPVIYPKYNPRNGHSYNDLEVIGNLVIITNSTGGFYVIDVLDPSSPSLVTSKDVPTGSLATHHPMGIYKKDNYAYIPTQEGVLRVYDISDIGNINQISATPIPSGARYIDGFGDFVFVALSNNGISAIDISDPLNPILIDTYVQQGANFYKVRIGKGLVFGINILGGAVALGFDGIAIPPDDDPEDENEFAIFDLPWDYVSSGLTFSQAALTINAYFDHEYPLLSMGWLLKEPLESRTTITSFNPALPRNLFYSSHDGYDWGSKAGAKYGSNVLAAAAGIATFMDTCTPCGNAILIDHGNGYQTRYYHLMSTGLITNDKETGVQVEKGQKIGQVGFSGYTIPDDKNGAHLHFMVVKDKDNDGEFDDNLPDGVVDPFGWLGETQDPWPNYSFEINSEVKTGAVSEYLWRKKLTESKEDVPISGKEIQMEHFRISFPQNTYSTDFMVNMNSSPIIVLSDKTESIGPSVSVAAILRNGSEISTFDNSFTIYFDFSTFDVANYDLSTVAIYSSTDGTNWVKEETGVNLTEKFAWTNINHLTYFALMADRIDINEPQTSIETIGNEGESGWYRTNVQLKLNPTDDISGIDYTVYRINDDDWREYESELEITSEGLQKFEYYSVDNAGNVEERKVFEFGIDKTYPEIKVFFDLESEEIKVLPQDDDKIEVDKKLFGRKIYKVSDKAGNFIEVAVLQIDLNVIHGLSFETIRYGDGEKIEVNKNYYSTVYNQKRGKIYAFGQYWAIDKTLLKLIYQPNKNRTLVINTSNPSSNEAYDGLRMLFIRTNDGSLEVWEE